MGEGTEREEQGTVRRMTAKKKKKKPSSKKKKPSKKKAGSKKSSKKKSKKKTGKKSSKKKSPKKKSSKKKAGSKKSSKKKSKKKTRKKSSKTKSPKKKSPKKKAGSKKSSKKKTKKKGSKKKSGKKSKQKELSSIFSAKPAEPPPPPAQKMDDKALSIYEKGMKAFYKKKYDAAETHFQQITDAFPGEQELRARVRMYLRLCEQHLGTEERSYDNPRDHYYRAIILSNRGNHDRAVEHLDEALKMVKRRKKPNVTEDQVQYVLAAAQAQAGELESAAAALLRAVELNPRNRLHALNSPDLKPLRESPEYQAIFTSPVEEDG